MQPLLSTLVSPLPLGRKQNGEPIKVKELLRGANDQPKNQVSLESSGTAKKERTRRSSTKGDVLFVIYLAIFVAALWASSAGYVPNQSWEVYSLQYHTDWMNWMNNHTYIPHTLAIAYVILTFGTKRWLADKPGYSAELRLPLAWWSFALAAFSFAGAVRTVPVVLSIIQGAGYKHLVCGDTRSEWVAENPAGLWTLVFCLSKIPELLDTAFIVLRKKPLITLHWYHHLTVMLFCWHAWCTMSLNGILFAAMNLTIHAVMYAFYALAAVGLRPSSFAIFLTLGQILQMAVGTAVTAYVTLDKMYWHPRPMVYDFKAPSWVAKDESQMDGQECYMSDRAAVSGFVMYSSYFYFFVEFFYNAYFSKNSKGAEA